jgi:hypothetical protein
MGAIMGWNGMRAGCWFLVAMAALIGAGGGTSAFAQAEPEARRRILPTDEPKFFRRTFPDERQETFFNLNQHEVVFTLNTTPLPFLDWAMVETGYIGWLGERGDVVPLNDPHDYTQREQILPVPFSVPSGIEIQAQKPERLEGMGDFFPDTKPWESGGGAHSLVYDEQAKTYHYWYGTKLGTAYATSKDLKHWDKPLTSTVKDESGEKTNVLYVSNMDEQDQWIFQHLKEAMPGRAGTFFMDPSAPPEERFKTTLVASSDPKKLKEFAKSKGKPLSPMVSPNSGNSMYGAVSPDGIAWRILKDPILLHDADTMTVTMFDKELGKYVMYTRLFELARRTIARSETKDFRDFPLPESVIAPGPEDKPYVDFYATSAVVYPNHPTLRLIFGLVYNRSIDSAEVQLATSRNGKLWHWVPGRPILEQGEFGTWDEYFVRTEPTFVPTPDDKMMIFYAANEMPHKFPRHKLQGGGHGRAIWKKTGSRRWKQRSAASLRPASSSSMATRFC